jgi:D-3-phosphoglycerate dehydrogenase
MTYDPYLSMDKAKELGIEPASLEMIYKSAHYITVHTPLTEETKHMISEKQFAMMKKEVRLINCARGGIIDEDALAAALEAGKVAGAAFDVYEQEPPAKDMKLLKSDKVVLAPHLGASTEEAQTNVAIEVAEIVRDALLTGFVKNAVNAPCLDPEILKVIEPYMKLAEKMGAMQAQLVDGHVKTVKIKYVGDLLKYDLSPFTLSIIKGMLTPILQETVNFVNSMVIAKDRGINITETRIAETRDFANLIIVDVETDKMKSSLTGTLFTKVDPRIVKINDSYVDAVPEGFMLVMSNKDVPGIIGQIGTILGKNNVNIAGMSFGREEKGGKAVSVLNIDSDVPKDVLDEIRKSQNIFSVKLVKL